MGTPGRGPPPLRSPVPRNRRRPCPRAGLGPASSLSPQLGPGSPPGVWVCSTDMLLSVPLDPGEPAEVCGCLP